MASKNSSLALISGYGSDSSDEDIIGCRVSTKRCIKDDCSENPLKKVAPRLPVPTILTQGSSDDNYLDDSSQHEGRHRSFPHERGNWATFVFIPCESDDVGFQDVLAFLLNHFTHLNLKTIDDFHISLTKTFVLKHHWIHSFIETVRNKLAIFKKFAIVFDSLEVYCNEERTRTFLGFQIKSAYDTLLNLVHTLDTCLDEFKLPLYYKDPSFHISIAWCLGDHEEQIRNVLPQINHEINEIMSNYTDNNWYIYVTNIICKTGNKLFVFDLT